MRPWMIYQGVCDKCWKVLFAKHSVYQSSTTTFDHQLEEHCEKCNKQLKKIFCRRFKSKRFLEKPVSVNITSWFSSKKSISKKQSSHFNRGWVAGFEASKSLQGLALRALDIIRFHCRKCTFFICCTYVNDIEWWYTVHTFGIFLERICFILLYKRVCSVNLRKSCGSHLSPCLCYSASLVQCSHEAGCSGVGHCEQLLTVRLWVLSQKNKWVCNLGMWILSYTVYDRYVHSFFSQIIWLCDPAHVMEFTHACFCSMHFWSIWASRNYMEIFTSVLPEHCSKKLLCPKNALYWDVFQRLEPKSRQDRHSQLIPHLVDARKLGLHRKNWSSTTH